MAFLLVRSRNLDSIPSLIAMVVYSGQEQHLNGGDDPYDREAIWLTGYDTSAELYQMIAKVNQIRKLAISKASTYTGYWAINVYTDNNNIAMRKGDTGSQIVAVYNNMGSSASSYPLKITGYHDFTAGETVTDVLSCSDVTVASDGTFTVTVTSGLPLVSIDPCKWSPVTDLPNFRCSSRRVGFQARAYAANNALCMLPVSLSCQHKFLVA